MLRKTEVVVIGGGQAGLAMSHCLSQLAIHHVVLERGRIGERWRSERWPGHLISGPASPNWPQGRQPENWRHVQKD